MRLGAWACDIIKDSIAFKVYGEKSINERHRHRFEFNDDYKEQIEAAGMKATGLNPETGLVEIIEIPNHHYPLGRFGKYIKKVRIKKCLKLYTLKL